MDETSVQINMARTTGCALLRERLVDHAPFDHWRTQTFVVALHHDRLDAPWIFKELQTLAMRTPLKRPAKT